MMEDLILRALGVVCAIVVGLIVVTLVGCLVWMAVFVWGLIL